MSILDFRRATSSLAAVSRRPARRAARGPGGAFVLAHLLQVVGQFGQGGRALAHQAVQAVALFGQQGLFALVQASSGLVWRRYR